MLYTIIYHYSAFLLFFIQASLFLNFLHKFLSLSFSIQLYPFERFPKIKVLPLHTHIHTLTYTTPSCAMMATHRHHFWQSIFQCIFLYSEPFAEYFDNIKLSASKESQWMDKEIHCCITRSKPANKQKILPSNGVGWENTLFRSFKLILTFPASASPFLMRNISQYVDILSSRFIFIYILCYILMDTILTFDSSASLDVQQHIAQQIVPKK